MSSPEKKTHILVVEDEGIVAKDLQSMLRRLGYHVPATVGTGEQAIQTAKEAQPDLILMDIQLRGNMDGVEASTAIKAQQDVPIVFLTANSDEATLQRAKITDPFGFLIKPFEERAIQAGIETALYKHRTEQRIREREQWLSTTLSSIADAVITTDPAGQITFLNDAAERLTGWRKEEAVGHPYSEVFHVLDETTRTEPRDRVAEALTEGTVGNFSNHTLLLARAAEEIHIEHSVAPIRQEDKEGINGCVIVFNDVSEKKALEEQLRQAQKMDAIGKLAGGIAHDFNNAITAIIGYAEMILVQANESDPLHREAKQIVRAAEHSARLTHQLLAFSRKQVLQPRRLDLAEELGNIEGMVKRLLGETITLETHYQPDIWPVMADPGQIHQVALNLSINARDAMPQGGQLTFEVCNVTLTEEDATYVQEGRPGEFVLLRISDTGMGMSPEVMKRIFEPFFTTKDPGKGTGLGLATCYGIIKQTSGMIAVESEVGVGTRFYVYLPKSEQVQTAATAKPVAPDGMPEGTETVLVVEDEEILRELAVQVLETLGYTVLTAEDGLHAQQILLADAERKIDLVVSDLMMPRMTGRELVTWIHEHFGEFRVLLMSGHTDDEIIKTSIEGSEMAYLQKPFTPKTLAQKIRAVLDGAGCAVAG